MHYPDSFPVASEDGSSYPYSPGSRGNSPNTSYEAATTIAPIAPDHRARILAALQAHSAGLCSEQIGRIVGLSVYAVRPRISELLALGIVEETGDTVKNDRGRNVTIWKAVADV
jgi:hypothetical protein